MAGGSTRQKGSSGSHGAHLCKAGDTREVNSKVVKHAALCKERERESTPGLTGV